MLKFGKNLLKKMADKDYKGIDKLMHFGVCALLALYSTELAVGAALGKEYADSRAVGNHWCWWDLFCDIIGIVMGSMVRCCLLGRYNWF